MPDNTYSLSDLTVLTYETLFNIKDVLDDISMGNILIREAGIQK